jgi:hypothetical protein
MHKEENMNKTEKRKAQSVTVALSFSDGAEQKAIRAADHLSTTFRQST